jgi:hypothetical protein
LKAIKAGRSHNHRSEPKKKRKKKKKGTQSCFFPPCRWRIISAINSRLGTTAYI